MDQDTIIRLAEEAGLEPRLWNHTDAFERFAALVAEHEREECAKAVQVRALANPGMMYMTADQCAAVIKIGRAHV